MPPFRLVISRPDSLGDAVLTLPLAGLVKRLPQPVQVTWLGKAYTHPLVAASTHVDGFLDVAELAKSAAPLRRLGADAILHVLPNRLVALRAWQAGIPLRVGTARRWWHWLYVNRRVRFSRRGSDLHEAQLNLKLLPPLGLGLPDALPLDAFAPLYGLAPQVPVPANWQRGDGRFRLVLHPKSQGSARDWPLAHYDTLARLLPADAFCIYVTGTAAEGAAIRAEVPELLGLPHVVDATGQMTLAELIAFLADADGLVAASTGPLHIAAALGRPVLGLYPPIRPMHPGRWAPLGARAEVLVADKPCADCRDGGSCHCMADLLPRQVAAVVTGWAAARR